MAMKGNERMAFQLAQAQRQFANMMERGEVFLVDRMGAPMQVGDMVLLSMPDPPLGRVIDIKPVVDPRQQPGLATAVIQFEFPLTARAGLPMRNVVIVARQQLEEDQQAAGEPKQDEPPPSSIIVTD